MIMCTRFWPIGAGVGPENRSLDRQSHIFLDGSGLFNRVRIQSLDAMAYIQN